MSMRLLFMGMGVFSFGCTPSDNGGDSADSKSGEEVNSACADYRTGYPEGAYGYSVGSILEDFPGMVDGTGTTQSLAQFHQDTSKTVLVIANAFDT